MHYTKNSGSVIRFWVKAALPTFLITLIMPFAIIFLPSASTILLTLAGGIFSVSYFFYKLGGASGPIKERGFITVLVATVAFLTLFVVENNLIQDKLLFGYKAVNDDLSPALVNGDHYFGDKLLFRQYPLKKGDIYVVRDPQGKVFAARLLYFPGDNIALEGRFHTLKDGEFGFYSGHKKTPAIVLPRARILARAVVIYWCFDPHSNSPVWERLGQVIR